MKVITTRYLGPTETRAPRITASDNDRHRVTIPIPNQYASDVDPHALAATALRDKMGWRGGLVGGHVKGGMVWVFVEGSPTINPDMYQPKTGLKCSCRRGQQRDNCSTCEGTGWVIDFRAIHTARIAKAEGK